MNTFRCDVDECKFSGHGHVVDLTNGRAFQMPDGWIHVVDPLDRRHGADVCPDCTRKMVKAAFFGRSDVRKDNLS